MTTSVSTLTSIFFGLLLLAGSCAHAQMQSLDTDGDGIPDRFDADDDGDGVLDPLDSDPTDSGVLERIAVHPWINELKVELHVETGRINVLAVEIAKLSTTDCNLISVHTYDENGLLVGKYVRNGDPNDVFSDGLYAGDVVGLFDPGVFRIGDTLADEKQIVYAGIPIFAPESYMRVEVAGVEKRKALEKGIEQLVQEGSHG